MKGFMVNLAVNFRVHSNIRHYRLIAYERCHCYDPSQKNFEYSHPYMEIYFVTEGRGLFHTGEKTTEISRGMIIINNPNVRHYETSDSKQELELACFTVSNLSFSASKDSPTSFTSKKRLPDSKQTFFFDYNSHYEELFDIIRVIEDEYCTKAPYWEYAFYNEFDKLLLFLMRHTTMSPLPYNLTQKPNNLSGAHQYIRARYFEDITLDKLSKIFFINKYYLVHSFKKRYGVTPIHFLHQVRCEHAKKMLENTDATITEIAASVGYNFPSHFSDKYKKIYGVSPLHTRNNRSVKK